MLPSVGTYGKSTYCHRYWYYFAEKTLIQYSIILFVLQPLLQKFQKVSSLFFITKDDILYLYYTLSEDICQ